MRCGSRPTSRPRCARPSARSRATESLGGAHTATGWFMRRWETPEVLITILKERRSTEIYANTKAVGWWSAWVGAPLGYVEPQQARFHRR